MISLALTDLRIGNNINTLRQAQCDSNWKETSSSGSG